MTVTTMTKPTRAPRMTCTWVPVRGADGRTRMEMRWTVPAAKHSRHAA